MVSGDTSPGRQGGAMAMSGAALIDLVDLAELIDANIKRPES
ncbi:phytoene dehydrogenase-like protein [Streptacidiphilus sp. MAP12-33]